MQPDVGLSGALVESFNGRLRDECRNEHRFTSRPYARAVIGVWRRQFNEERPKRELGGFAPAEFAQHNCRRKTLVLSTIRLKLHGWPT